MHSIEHDPRIGATHISLYLSLLYTQHQQSQNPITIKRPDIMRLAKIHSRHTYNICMNQLHEYGYIKYQPSSNPFEGSTVYLLID